ncbi:MAG: hypothetical protein MJZ27_09610 [Bacteroidales bacterium]|nr:hypothetical protein [Bacteroidales bacterium]
MERNLLIELLETGEKVSLYSPRFEGEEYTEFEKFLMEFKDSHTHDIQVLVRRLSIIKQNGAEDRYFRYEGTMNDRVMGLPSHIDTSELRLYCLNISRKVLILGSGGIKTTKTYEQDIRLHRCVQTLQKIDIEIKHKERRQIVTITGTRLAGPLTFTIDEDDEE